MIDRGAPSIWQPSICMTYHSEDANNALVDHSQQMTHQHIVSLYRSCGNARAISKFTRPGSSTPQDQAISCLKLSRSESPLDITLTPFVAQSMHRVLYIVRVTIHDRFQRPNTISDDSCPCQTNEQIQTSKIMQFACHKWFCIIQSTASMVYSPRAPSAPTRLSTLRQKLRWVANKMRASRCITMICVDLFFHF